jgi:predicted small lipoprotein YifL
MKRIALGLVALAALAGCGMKGGLERPGPMWDSEEAVAAERARLEEERAESERRRQAQPPASPQPQ